MKNRSVRWFMGLLILLSFSLMACGQKKSEVPTEEERIEAAQEEEKQEPEVVVPEPEPEEEGLPAGMVYSPLTGEPVTEELAMSRPYAVMINNIKFANPQSGIGEADIIYEALAEGGITRMMVIFPSDITLDRIGSCRSARHYFVSVAAEYDAIFVHYGHTKYATAKIAKLGVNNVSGLSSVGDRVFYRDKSIKAPHNAFISADGIRQGIELLKYRTELKAPMTNHFDFYEEKNQELSASGEPAKKIVLGFSSYTSPYFTYDAASDTYLRFQFDGPHVDATTKKQLAFQNIIIEVVKESNIDKKGYQTIAFEDAKGTGYYITGGRAVPITWSKKEDTAEMVYYDSTGKKLTIQPGKTFIALYPENRVDQLKILEE